MTDSSDVLIDLEMFKAAQQLMGTKFQRLLGYFFEDTEAYLASIEEGLLKNDVALIIPAAHTIKSSSFQLGAKQLSLKAAELESAGKKILLESGNVASLVDMSQILKSLFTDSRDQLTILEQRDRH